MYCPANDYTYFLRFFRFIFCDQQPGWIVSKAARPRLILSMIFCTVAVHTKGFGFSFQARKNSSMAPCSSGTLIKAARRTASQLPLEKVPVTPHREVIKVEGGRKHSFH